MLQPERERLDMVTKVLKVPALVLSCFGFIMLCRGFQSYLENPPFTTFYTIFGLFVSLGLLLSCLWGFLFILRETPFEPRFFKLHRDVKWDARMQEDRRCRPQGATVKVSAILCYLLQDYIAVTLFFATVLGVYLIFLCILRVMWLHTFTSIVTFIQCAGGSKGLVSVGFLFTLVPWYIVLCIVATWGAIYLARLCIKMVIDYITVKTPEEARKFAGK